MSQPIQQSQQYIRITKMLVASQRTKEALIPYLQEHYPNLLNNNKKLARIKGCTNTISFRRFLDTGKVTIFNNSFCNYSKFCLACASKRATGTILKFISSIPSYPFWYYITLPMSQAPGQSLESFLAVVFLYRDELARNYKNSKRANHKTKSFLNQFAGLAMSVEIGLHAEHGYTAHIRILACGNTEIPQAPIDGMGVTTNADLVKEWGYGIGNEQIASMHAIDMINQPLFTAVADVFQYDMKFGNFHIPMLAELINLQSYYQYRLFTSYGALRGLKSNYARTSDGGSREDATFLFNGQTQNYSQVV